MVELGDKMSKEGLSWPFWQYLNAEHRAAEEKRRELERGFIEVDENGDVRQGSTLVQPPQQGFRLKITAGN